MDSLTAVLGTVGGGGLEPPQLAAGTGSNERARALACLVVAALAASAALVDCVFNVSWSSR